MLHSFPRISHQFPLPHIHCGTTLGNGYLGLSAWGSGNMLNLSVGCSSLWDHRGGMMWTEKQNYPAIRAALEAILDYGRPKTVELLVLVDRGHRELPIHGDYVGRKINTARSEKVNVLMEERDGRDEVVLESADA